LSFNPVRPLSIREIYQDPTKQGSRSLARMNVWPKTYLNVSLLTLTLKHKKVFGKTKWRQCPDTGQTPLTKINGHFTVDSLLHKKNLIL